MHLFHYLNNYIWIKKKEKTLVHPLFAGLYFQYKKNKHTLHFFVNYINICLLLIVSMIIFHWKRLFFKATLFCEWEKWKIYACFRTFAWLYFTRKIEKIKLHFFENKKNICMFSTFCMIIIHPKDKKTSFFWGWKEYMHTFHYLPDYISPKKDNKMLSLW